MRYIVAGNPTQREVEDITQLWQSALGNAHIEVSRYMVGENKVLFVYKDGAQAYEANDFLLKQVRFVTNTRTLCCATTHGAIAGPLRGSDHRRQRVQRQRCCEARTVMLLK